MRCLLRTDIGGNHGMGHAVRCLALAKALQARGAEVSFVTSTPALAVFVAPFACVDTLFAPPLPKIDAYVVDTKDADLSEDYYATVRRNGPKVVRIDHPSATPGACDLLIAPVAHWSPETVSRLRTAFGERFLYGLEYVMLAPEVTAQTPVPYAEREHGMIVFCAGGSDPSGALAQMHTWAKDVLPDAHKYFCVGAQQDIPCGTGDGYVRFDRAYLAEASLAVCLFGVTPYECLSYRTPVLMLAHTEENCDGAQWLMRASNGAAWWIGSLNIPEALTTQGNFCASMQYAWTVSKLRMHDASVNLLDGLGTQRVADAILGLA